jgi:hypothetical protein
MTNRGEQVFRLIKTLNRVEKGYFKKFAKINSGQTSARYLNLFDILDRMSEYDDEKVKKLIAKTGDTVHLTMLKSYLYKLILKSLRNFSENNNPELAKLMRQADKIILESKGLREKKQKGKAVQQSVGMSERVLQARLKGKEKKLMSLYKEILSGSPEQDMQLYLDACFAMAERYRKKKKNSKTAEILQRIQALLQHHENQAAVEWLRKFQNSESEKF